MCFDCKMMLLPYIKTYKIMDLQFAVEESLETLCFHYLLNQKQKSKVVIINSILLHESSSSSALFNIFRACRQIADEQSMDNPQASCAKQCWKNMAQLMMQVIKKMGNVVKSSSSEEKKQIIRYCCQRVFCALSGNDFIILVHQIVKKTSENEIVGLLGSLEAMIFQNRMHIGSYRQNVRNHLYTLLLVVLKGKNKQQLLISYIERVIRALESEKDPRNMIVVLQIYYFILQNSAKQQIQGMLQKIFECIQVYYPIDFEGDPTKHKIDLKTISFFLDRCLTHPLLYDRLEQLLKIKMAAMPISLYIPTFFMAKPSAGQHESYKLFCRKLLLKTCEQEFLDEDYTDKEYDLSDLIHALLSSLVSDQLSVDVYFQIVDWMDKMIVSNVMSKEENGKVAGKVIQILQKIMNKGSQKLRKMVGGYVGKKFIEHIKSEGQIVYKMGMLVPVLENNPLDSEISALIILSLNQIFHQQQQPQPKILILKLFMLLFPHNSTLINQTNILLSCLKLFPSNQDHTISKAYIDFLVALYSNDNRVYSTIKSIPESNIRIYGIITLSLKTHNAQHLQSLKHQWKSNPRQCMKMMKSLKVEPILKVVEFIGELSFENAEELQRELGKKPIGLDEQKDFMGKYIQNSHNMSLLFVSRKLWRKRILQQEIRKCVKQCISSCLGQQPDNPLALACAAYFNQTMQAFKMQQQLIKCSQNNQYSQILSTTLPVHPTLEYSPTKDCDPTLIHYLWTYKEHMRPQLIGFLPQCLLSQQVDQILPSLLKSADMHTLSKIFNSIPEHTAASDVIPFVVEFILGMNNQSQVKTVVGANNILADALKRAETEEDVHDQLLRMKGKILVGLEEKGLQHHKRRVRQSSRMVFSQINMLK